jgi:hypothetical protein
MKFFIVNTLFDACVDIHQYIGEATGLGYKAANIWIFVIIHPAITILLFFLFVKYRLLYSKLKRQKNA